MLNLKNVASALVLAAAASQVGATNCGEITRDPGFDLWCGDSLCAWTLERGMVKEVPTWNAGDPGVELVGSDVAIAQLTSVDSNDGTCLEFDLIANVDEGAQVTLGTDIDGDGSVEQTEQIPTSSWKPLSFLVSVQAPFSGIRFELAKRGNGNAVLAEISAKIVDDSLCAGLATIASAPQPDGEPCTTGADCASGTCGSNPFYEPFSGISVGFVGVCGGCSASGSSCAGSDVCGAGAPTAATRAVPLECVAPASAALGEQCATGPECASGLCFEYVCSSCDPTQVDGCGSGVACGSAWGPQTVDGAPVPTTGPYVCGPNAGHGAPSAPCANDADCASGTCAGTPRMQCFDGRTCASNADCPVGEDGDAPLQNGGCATVGVQGGTCQ